MDPSAKADAETEPPSASAAVQAVTAARPTDAPRRCFICLTDEEPTDPAGSWVDPCPCTLEAHQDCMLSWVTDCERSNKPLKCPVCKSVIEMDGPWDPIASLHDALQRKFTRASPFILLTGVSVGVQFSLQMYGAMALWTFAGREALLRFALGPDMLIDGRSPGALRFAKERIVNALILMNVAPTLLISQLLPGLTNRYFMQSASIYGIYSMIRNDNFLEWPPSPRMAMVALPIIRKLYFSFWRDFVMPYEIKLNRQISGLPPLEPHQNADGALNRQDLERNGEGGFIGLLQNILDVLDPDEEDPAAAANNGGREARAGGGARNEIRLEQREEGDEIRVEVLIEEIGNDAVELPNGVLNDDQDDHPHWDQAQDERANGHPQENQRDAPQAPPARRMGLGGLLSNVSNSIVGALLLPGISYAMGEALRLILPRSWTTLPYKSHFLFGPSPSSRPGLRPGLLQQQWGRSLVGGCLYVVLNDVIRVYSKSRQVAAMQNRRVKNVDRPRRRK
ncbi:ring finger domain [Trichoderma arundinaceum]|uniref:Ring finger domain n=1 Tax=Trichoderma arundinaceum TaxID=490622 RepID=A0A395NC00_TRIAR|nr:ring finger domain [Trichoderma arundinaceum]